MVHYLVEVGQIDPDFSDNRIYCNFNMPGHRNYRCTMPDGHDEPHVAHNESTGEVLEIWSEPIPEAYWVDEGL